jgi:hypothetical protein
MWNVGRMIRFICLVAVVLAGGPEGVFAQKKKKDADTPQNSAATEADYAALKATWFPLTIVALDPGKTLTVRETYKKKEANPNYKPLVTNPTAPGYNAQDPRLVLQKKQADLQVQLQKAVNTKNAQATIARINQDIASTNAQLAKINSDPNYQAQITNTYSKDYELAFEKKVVYRKMFLPDEVDKDGNPVKLSAEEKLVLRGSESPPLPGYIAKADDIQEGQEVKLYLTLPKKKAKDDTTPAEHPTVRMIVATKKAGYETETPKKK